MPRLVRSVSAASRRRAMTHAPARLPVVNKRPVVQVVRELGRPIRLTARIPRTGVEACGQG